MKKMIWMLFICILITLDITGCENSKNEFDVGNQSNIQITEKGVSLSIKNGTLTDKGATLILKNDSNKVLRYDEVYRIEIKQNKKWYEINTELFFDEPLWGVKQNSKEEFDLKWEYSYGKLAKGEYRIIKEVYFEDEIEQKFYVSAEFQITS